MREIMSAVRSGTRGFRPATTAWSPSRDVLNGYLQLSQTACRVGLCPLFEVKVLHGEDLSSDRDLKCFGRGLEPCTLTNYKAAKLFYWEQWLGANF